MHIYQVLFTDELALAYCGRNVIFISDIRAIDPRNGIAEQVVECIGNDMQNQQRWVALM